MRAAILWGAAVCLAVLGRPAEAGQTRAAQVSRARSGVSMIGPIVNPLGPSSMNLTPLAMTPGGVSQWLSISAPSVVPGISAQVTAAKSAGPAASADQAPAKAAPTAVTGSLSVIAAVKTAAGGGDLRAGISAEAITPSPSVLGSASAGRDWAADSFELLTEGGALRQWQASDAAEAPASRGWAALKPSALGGRLVKNAPPQAASLHQAAPSFWEKPLGRTVGSVLSFLFPLPDVVASFRQVDNRSPTVTADHSSWKDSVLAVVSLILGLINALLSKMLWGISGIFGGLIILPILIARWASARRAAAPANARKASSSQNWSLGWNKPVKDALVTSVILLALSAALYFGAAAALPALLGHWLAPAAVTKLIFWIRAASVAVYAGFYLPQAFSALRRWRLRRAAKLSQPSGTMV